MNKLNLDSISRDDLIKIVADVQYALRGHWDRDSDLHYDTGIPMDKCGYIMDSINKFLSIDAKSA